MSEAGALLRAIVGEFGHSDQEILTLLEAALILEVDPLDYCAHRFGLGEMTVMQRAAAWAGLDFLPAIPTASGVLAPGKLERFAEIRSVRLTTAAGDVSFTAPGFASFIVLKRLADRRPGLKARLTIVPESAIRRALAEMSEVQMIEAARHRLVRRWPRSLGQVDAPLPARIGFVLLLLALLLVVVMAPWIHAPVFLPIVGLALVIPAIFRIAAVVLAMPHQPTVALLEDADLPVYSVLVPLRDEAQMVPQLADALRSLDYPPEKLDIQFVVETRSLATVAAVQAELYDPRFELVLVPDALPRTKPKALNFALPLIRGEHLVVYDAEDIPAPGQLRLAASTFAAHPKLACLQAELVIDNAGEGWLQGLFAGEYAGQFGLMLPLLARLGLPMPLGGTSNHFRTSALKRVGGWDAYNVTEDADLGVRLARLGLRTATINSRTGEEAPIRLAAWIKQRTRWMKGWMQTLIVHTHDWRRLRRELGWTGLLGMYLYIGSMLLSAPLHTVFLGSLPLVVMGWSGPWPPVWVQVTAAAIFVVGYLGPAVLAAAGLTRLKRLDLLPVQILLPFYWVLHGVAVVLACWDLIADPFGWAKTRHGETRVLRSTGLPAPAQAE